MKIWDFVRAYINIFFNGSKLWFYSARATYGKLQYVGWRGDHKIMPERLPCPGNIFQTLELQLAEIQALIERAGRYSESLPQAIREQLKQQMEILLDVSPALPEERITQEAVMLMIKVDVREELDRLRAHTSTARKLRIDGRVIGRKLDFLCQELNREVNTLCSKANNIELSNIGLDLKAVIEQFREQVQNIE